MSTWKRGNAKQLSQLVLIAALMGVVIWALNVEAQTQRKKAIKAVKGPQRGVNYSRFDHDSHSPRCNECHRVAEGKRVTSFPVHNACDDCHFFPAFTIAQRGFCIICHTPPGNTARMQRFPEQRSDQFAIKFPHNIHVGMDVKDYNPIVAVSAPSEEQLKIQEVSIKNGCYSCHVKDGKERKEENYSKPHHPECAQCHGDEGKKVAPAMNNCAGCHIAPMPGRVELSNLVANFRHDRDHERDIRPEAKTKKMLDCKFCHKTAVRAKKLVDIQAPEESSCLACHNKDVGAVILTPKQTARLKKGASPAEQPSAKPADTPKQ